MPDNNDGDDAADDSVNSGFMSVQRRRLRWRVTAAAGYIMLIPL